MWQDNFLLASLNKKYLYRIKFNDDYNKVIYKEPIYVGDRIRDLIYNKASKKIFAAEKLVADYLTLGVRKLSSSRGVAWSPLVLFVLPTF